MREKLFSFFSPAASPWNKIRKGDIRRLGSGLYINPSLKSFLGFHHHYYVGWPRLWCCATYIIVWQFWCWVMVWCEGLKFPHIKYVKVFHAHIKYQWLDKQQSKLNLYHESSSMPLSYHAVSELCEWGLFTFPLWAYCVCGSKTVHHFILWKLQRLITITWLTLSFCLFQTFGADDVVCTRIYVREWSLSTCIRTRQKSSWAAARLNPTTFCHANTLTHLQSILCNLSASICVVSTNHSTVSVIWFFVVSIVSAVQ